MLVLHEVDEAPGRCHQKVAAPLELLDLSVELGAAHHNDRTLAGLLADDAYDALDLRRQLARGRDHQGVRAFAPCARHELQRGQCEGGCLARARLGGGNDVSAREHHGDGLGLDGGWFGEAEVWY